MVFSVIDKRWRITFLQLFLIAYCSFVGFTGEIIQGDVISSIHISPLPNAKKFPDGAQRSLYLRISGTTIKGKGSIIVKAYGKTEVQEFKATEQGHKEFTVFMPPGDMFRETNVRVLIECENQQLQTELRVPPLPIRNLYILPHSHIDIGYTHHQDSVLKLQWANLEKAIQLCRKTQDFPNGARFKWNSEVLWAVNDYLKNASQEKKDRLLSAIRKGWIGLDGLYANLLTGLSTEEELIHAFDAANRLRKEYNFKINGLMITDVPGFSWGLIPAMAQNGIRYFSAGPNFVPHLPHKGFRVGLTHETWGDVPFYWISPSGKEKILFWASGKGYSWFHDWLKGRLSKSGEQPIWEYIDELEQKNYPYDLAYLRYTIGGDNGLPDEELPGFVAEWNKKYAYPQLKIALTAEVFEELEQKYHKVLPRFRGDFTPYWEDGAASSAFETALNRRTANLLVTAEKLWTCTNPQEFPQSKFDEAWRNVLLFSEHTWGASNSVSEPDNLFVQELWAEKRNYGQKAARLGDELLQEFIYPDQKGSVIHTFKVFNPSSWNRSDLVRLPLTIQLGGKKLLDEERNQVPIQQLKSGEWIFVAKQVPPLGFLTYFIENLRGKEILNPNQVKMYSSGLENRWVKIELDQNSGTIHKLESKLNDHDFAGEEGLNEYLYTGKNATSPQRSLGFKLREGGRGPVMASIILESVAPGTKSLKSEFILYADLPRIDLINTLVKQRVYEKENVRFFFPFSLEDAELTYDLAWAVMNPEKDQLAGANNNYYTLQNWVDLHNEDIGLTMATLDAPLLEIGEMSGEAWMESEDLPWKKSYSPSTSLYSWVMNNSWFTNYRAFQEGEVQFRYAFLAHEKFSVKDTKKFGYELVNPLVAVLNTDTYQSTESIISLNDSCSVIVSSLRPVSNGRNLMLRLFNASDQPVSIPLRESISPVFTIFKSSPMEEMGSELTGRIKFAPFEILTVKLIK